MSELTYEVLANMYGFYAVPKEYMMRVVPKVLKEGRVYEPRTINFIRQNASDGDVISGGAFVGDFFPAISRALKGNARLHSFEPNPISFEACKKTISLNGLKNVIVHPLAVGESEGECVLRTFDFRKNEPAAAQSSVVEKKDTTGSEFLSVKLSKLDNIIPKERYISILQLDIEGYEKHALLGAVEIIERCKPIIILEGKTITAEFLNKTFRNCSYVSAGFFERNQFFVANRTLEV